MTSHLLCLTTCPTRNWTCGGRASLGSGLCKVEIKFRDSRIGGWILSLGNFKQEPVQSSHLCPWTWKPPLPDIRPEGPSIQEGPTEHQRHHQLEEAQINDSPWYPSSWGWATACTKISTTQLSANSPWKKVFSHISGIYFPKLKSTWCESTVQPAGWSHKFCSPLCCPYTAR